VFVLRRSKKPARKLVVCVLLCRVVLCCRFARFVDASWDVFVDWIALGSYHTEVVQPVFVTMRVVVHRGVQLLKFSAGNNEAAACISECARRASDASFIHPEFRYRRQLLLY